MKLRQVYRNYRKSYLRAKREHRFCGGNPQWGDRLLKRLAAALKQEAGAVAVEYGGPAGLACNCYIELFFDELELMKPFDERTGWRLSLRCHSPVGAPESIRIGVTNYSLNAHEFGPHSIGALNGLNHPAFPLSADLDMRDVLSLMNSFSPTPKKAREPERVWQVHSTMGTGVRTIEVTGKHISVNDNTQVVVDGVTIDVQEQIVGIDEMPETADANPMVIYP